MLKVHSLLVLFVVLFAGILNSTFSQTDSAKIITDSSQVENVGQDSAVSVMPETDIVADTNAVSDSILSVNNTAAAEPSQSDTTADSNNVSHNTGELSVEKKWAFNTNVYYKSIKVADINKDGKNEIILCTSDMVYIYSFNDGKLELMSEYKAKRVAKIVGVDAGDIAGNGDVHIFVSATDYSKKYYKSFILKYDNKSLSEVDRKIDCIFNVVTLSNNITELHAQKKPSGNFNKCDTYTMRFVDNKYELHDKIGPMATFPIFGLDYSKGLSPKTSFYCGYNKSGNFVLLNVNTYETEYESTEKLSGNPDHLIISENNSGGEIFSLSAQTIATDLNGDENNEVIVVKNYDVFNSLMARTRIYNRSHIEIFSIKNSNNVNSKWKSSKMTGYIAGIDYADFDNDGTKELIVVRVIKTGEIMFTKPNIEIVAYTIE